MQKQKNKSGLTHVSEAGELHMVDVADKRPTSRIARAQAVIKMSSKTINLVKENAIKKGDVLQVAKVAGIMAAKNTATLIPLCHTLLLSKIEVEIQILEVGLRIVSLVKCEGKTGVEMEALTACSVAALTIYDMCKAVDKSMVVEEIHLLEKKGGKSGDFQWSRSRP